MVDSLYYLVSLLFFDIPLLSYIILILDHQINLHLRYSIILFFNLRSSIILWLGSGDIYFYLSISFSFVSKLFFWWRIWLLQFYQQFYFQLNHRLLLLFWIAPFEAVFSASVADHLASFWLYLLLEYLLIFLPIFLPMFLAKEKDR